MLEVKGTLTFAGVGPLWAALTESIADVKPGERLDFDMSKVEAVDGGSMALLVALRADLHRRGATSEFIGADEPIQKIIQLYRGDVKVGPRKRRRARGLLDHLGGSTLALLDGFKQVFGFFGQALVADRRGARRSRAPPTGGGRADDGARRAPTRCRSCVLINFLIGCVMAFQAAVQLKQFGANIYVADLVGLSITPRAGPADDGDHRLRPLGRGVRRRARHHEGVGGDRRAAHDGLRPDAVPGPSAACSRCSS